MELLGPPEDLEQLGIDTVVDLSGVGRNLQDHVLLAGLCFEAKHPLPPPNYNLAGSTAFWKSRPGLGVPDLMFLPLQIPAVSDEIAARYPIPPNVFSIVPGLVRVRSRGHLRMKTAGHDGRLEIQPNFLAEQADVDALAAGVELGLDIASQPACRPAQANGPGRCRGVYSPLLLELFPRGRAGKRWWTPSCASEASRVCASPTPRSCRRSPRPTPTRRWS